MHGGGDGEGQLIDKNVFFLFKAPRNKCKAIIYNFTSDYRSPNWQIYKVSLEVYAYPLSGM